MDSTIILWIGIGLFLVAMISGPINFFVVWANSWTARKPCPEIRKMAFPNWLDTKIFGFSPDSELIFSEHMSQLFMAGMALFGMSLLIWAAISCWVVAVILAISPLGIGTLFVIRFIRDIRTDLRKIEGGNEE